MQQIDASAIATRGAAAADGPSLAAISRQFEWPHRVEDWALALRIGRGRVAVALDGTVMGSACWWRYGAEVASIGLVMVTGSARGTGLGRRLMGEAVEANPGSTLFLNSTDEGLPLYRKFGFEATGALHQWQGRVRASVRPPSQGEEPEPLSRSDLARIARFDAQAFGADRRDLLAALLETGAEGACIRSGGQIVAYALCRRFGRGLVVGPVVAERREQAAVLLAHFLHRHRGAFVRTDVAGSAGLDAVLTEAGLLPSPPVTMMVRPGAAPRTFSYPAAGVVAVASQAFG